MSASIKPPLPKPPVVLCVDYDSYVCAIASMETLAEHLPDAAAHIKGAVEDFKRAHATFMRIDSHTNLPALLRRQAE